MQLRGIHYLSAVLALSALLLLVQNDFAVGAGAEFGISGWVPDGQTSHLALSGVMSILAAGLLVQCWRARHLGWMAGVSFAAMVVIVAQAAIGASLAAPGASPWMRVTQTMLSHGLVTLAFVLYLSSSQGFMRRIEPVEDELQPPLRSLAWWPAVLVVAQILFGSAYRQGILGVIPHLSLAFLTAGGTAFLAILVATTFPDRRALRRAALVVAGLTGTQIVLGFVALLGRLQTSPTGADSGSAAWSWIFAAGHVLLGSATLAATVWLAISIRTNIRPQTQAAKTLLPRAESAAVLEPRLH
ncbi:MAG: hypothetical protein LC114_12525 [Bryobacterales bacterium]|nr:hypothetical protein [Bryobacterales bacterium]